MSSVSKHWIVGILAVLAAGAVIFFIARSRVVVTINSGNVASAASSTQNSAGQNVAPSTLPPLDIAAYNAKLLEITNLPKPAAPKNASSTASSTTHATASSTPPVATGPWPVKAAYPANGAALLPFNRIVAFYGNLYSTQMGVLGQYPVPQMLQMLASTSAEWAAADPSTPVIPALDYIVVSAQASPGADGDYRLRMPASQVNQIISMAAQVHGIVFLDVQVGLSTVEQEVPLLAQYLKLPQVNLSLDPEFDMHNGARPGTVIGTMDASDINWAANYLANIATQNNLPPKILVVHRFTDGMVTNTDQIKPLPQVQVVMDMDGFGPESMKLTTYRDAIYDYPVQFTGFKLFFKNDQLTAGSHMMTPAEILKLSPQPSYIQYQ